MQTHMQSNTQSRSQKKAIINRRRIVAKDLMNGFVEISMIVTLFSGGTTPSLLFSEFIIKHLDFIRVIAAQDNNGECSLWKSWFLEVAEGRATVVNNKDEKRAIAAA